MSELKVNAISPSSGTDLTITSNVAIGTSITDAYTLTLYGNVTLAEDANLVVDTTGGSTSVFEVNSTTEVTTMKNLEVISGSLVVNATLDTVVAHGLMIADDEGTGLIDNLTLTNVVDTTQTSAVGTIVTGSAVNTTGFIKAYVGTTVVWIPYFASVS